MANTMNTNGRPMRKSLAEQLDRLEGVIENLADGLNQTVAEVVKEAVTVAVQQAIQGVVQAVVANPGLLRQLTGQVNTTPGSTPEPKPSRLKKAWQWLRTKLGSTSIVIKERMRRLGNSIRTKLGSIRLKLGQNARGFFPALAETARKVWRLRRPVALSLLIGMGACGIGIVSGPDVSVVLLGLAVSALSLTGFVVMPFVRLMRAMQVES
jgi:hypothetical protein